MSKHPEYQYLDLAERILTEWVKNVDRANGDVSYSLFGAQCRYDLSKGFPLLTTKKVYWKGVVTELIWFITGQSNIRFLVENNVHIWDDYPYYVYNGKVKKQEKENSPLIKGDGGILEPLTKEGFIAKILEDADFAEKYGNLKNIYGEAWRRWPTKDPERTVDQIKFVLRELTEDPDARNAIVTAWNPEYMYTMAKPEEANKFPICHAMFQFSIKEGKLSCQLYQRSADLFLGVPFNIASYALLTHILAKLLGVGVGDFVHTFGDVHIYETHIEQMREQLAREPKDFPTLTISDSLVDVDHITHDMITLENYDPHPPIKAAMAVVGGMVGRDDGN
jgi:thymidylate synthase